MADIGNAPADPSAGADTDAALLAAFAAGDRMAAGQLTTRLGPRVFGLALRLLGDRAEAEDVAQEAMLRLWRIAPDWRHGEARVTTWLYRVTVNLVTDRRRRGRDRMSPLDQVDEPADPSPGVARQMLDAQRHDALQAALMQLPERQREAVVLRHIEELGNPEIAGIMDISTEAVESLTARGKRALAAILAGQRADLGYDDD
ncbi:RNA polymerase sigma factor [Seohaeicola nanhaiensis]|uniref:RNA polymerase sigma factor n=1 Tax=Seohaeicola nanhaiensis TaxID=1387282 RepID=A0ABV9KJ31_9RHOB